MRAEQRAQIRPSRWLAHSSLPPQRRNARKAPDLLEVGRPGISLEEGAKETRKFDERISDKRPELAPPRLSIRRVEIAAKGDPAAWLTDSSH